MFRSDRNTVGSPGSRAHSRQKEEILRSEI